MTDVLPRQLLQTLTEHRDPLRLGRLLWPDKMLYGRQVEVVNAVRESVETHCVAGNQLGKDWVSGFIAVTFFLAPWCFFDEAHWRRVEAGRTRHNTFPHTRRIVTTSVNERHLAVLWGEIGDFVRTSAFPLRHEQGGPLVLNHQEMRFSWERDETSSNVKNYCRGVVMNPENAGEGLAGHHAAYTLFLGDEASGLDDKAHAAAQGWAKRFLYIGNPNDCQNFFRRGVEAGDLVA